MINENANELNNTRIKSIGLNNPFIFSLFLIIDTLVKINSAKIKMSTVMETSETPSVDPNMNPSTNEKKRKLEAENIESISSATEPNTAAKINRQNINQKSVKNSNRRKYKFRKEDKREKNEVNTVLFKLKDGEVETLEDEDNLLEAINKRMGFQVKEAPLSNRRLYVTPFTEGDHDKIIRSEVLDAFDVKTLFNKTNHFVIKEISINIQRNFINS